MRRIDIARRAGRNLRQAKGRTFLTSLAIAVGAFTLTLSLAAGEGARQYAENLLKNNVDPQALFITKDDSLTSGNGGSTKLQEYSDASTEGYRPSTTVKLLTKDDIAKLSSRSDLDNVVPIYNITPTYAQFFGKDTKYSAGTTYYDSTVKSETAAGELPELGKQIADDEILLPEEWLTQLGVSPRDAIGKKVQLTFARQMQQPSNEEIQNAFMAGGQVAVTDLVKPENKVYEFTVRAVLKKSAMAITSFPRLHISTSAAKTVTEFSEGTSKTAGQVMGVTALAKGNAEDVKKAIKKDYGFSVQTAKDAQSLLFTFVNVLQGIVAGFAMLALIASVFGIINTQYISVLERTSQIGLMKALGMSRSAIAKLFRYEAAWIGFLGGLIGVGLGLLVGWAANPSITEALNLGENSLLIFVWWQLAILVLSLVVIAIVAGWFPARKAARLDPIEALRTE